MQLQSVAADLGRAGLALFAVSYDAVSVLAEFASGHGITFPLLSDEESAAITALGLLDTHLVEHHAAFGVQTRDDQQGVAYPTTFVLDRDGRVTRRIAEANYRVRAGGAWLLRLLTGREPAMAGVSGRAAGDVVELAARLDSPAYFPYQRLGLHVTLNVAAGWHVYGPATPAGYTPLAVRLENAPGGIALGAIEFPVTHPFRVEGLAESFEVYEGAVELAVPIEFITSRGTGEVRFDVVAEYQACSATECLPPSTARVSLAVPEAPVP